MSTINNTRSVIFYIDYAYQKRNNDVMKKQASHIFKLVGKGCERAGRLAVADATGLSSKQMLCWTYPRDKGGTDGFIPSKWHPVILAAFPKLITHRDFFIFEERDAA